MKMKKIALVILAIAGLMCFSPLNGFAFSLYNNYAGQLEFHFQAWDDGTTYTPEVVAGAWTGYWLPSDGGAKVFDSTYGINDHDQDSWGVGTVTSITKVPTGPLWSQIPGGETLDIHLYGLDDDFVKGTFDALGNPTGLHIESVPTNGSAYLDVYLGPGANDFDPTVKANALSTVTDGTKFLRLEFVPVGPNGVVYTTDYTPSLLGLPTTGNGSGYLKVVHGWGDATWEDIFDSNTYDSVSPGADFYLYNDYSTSGAGQWLVKAQDPVTGYATPEPASMLMLGLGILGCASLRRKTAA